MKIIIFSLSSLQLYMDYNDGTYFGNDGFYQNEPITFEETEIGTAHQLTTVHEQPLNFKREREVVVEPPAKKIIEPFTTGANWNVFLLILIAIVFAMQIHVMATLNTFITLSNRRP